MYEMTDPIYKVWMSKAKDAYYELSPEERNKLYDISAEALKQVGGEMVVACFSSWCSEKWILWGVEKFPNIEAVQKHAQMLFEKDWFKYTESISYLGTEATE